MGSIQKDRTEEGGKERDKKQGEIQHKSHIILCPTTVGKKKLTKRSIHLLWKLVSATE